MADRLAPELGREYVVRFPFLRCEFHPDRDVDDTGGFPPPVKSWRPGTDFEAFGPDGERVRVFAHGEGEMILSVVSVHRPGHYPPRVFFTRKFRDPDGKLYGKRKLHIVTLEKFRRLVAGYAVSYDIEEERRG